MAPIAAIGSDEAAALDRGARAAMSRHDARAARQALDVLAARFPRFAPGWLTASVFALDLGHAGRALQACERGLTLAPDEPALHVQRVRCLQAAGRRADALAAASAAEPRVAASPSLQHELANVLSRLGEHARALTLMQAAAERLPPDPALDYNMATVLRFLGDFEAAEALLDRVIAARPDDWEAWGARSQLSRQTPARNHVAELAARLAPPPGAWAGEVQLRYALAKEYEDLGEWAKSFAELRAGASLRRAQLSYDVGEDVAMLDCIAATFDADWMAGAGQGVADEAPIFVMGLPRSGTTLVERILDSHPGVRSLGELNDFPAVVAALGRRPGARPPSKLDLLKVVAATPPGSLGEAYLARVAPLRDGGARFVDKLPMNYLYAGLIAAGLSRASLVLVERHPMAGGYAMYKTLFQQGYPFSYDLDDLGRYIAAYLRLAAHWKALLGERLTVVRYEDLVGDQEGETRRLLDACGLTWDDAVLRPHENTAPSSTQSAVQVRQPIYRHAVAQWRAYAAELGPLAARLGDV